MLGGALLLTKAVTNGDGVATICVAIYATSSLLLYTFSTLYHGSIGQRKIRYRVLDHQAIYLLIAGSYTPFLAVALDGSAFLWMLGGIWSLAIIGVIMDGFPRRGPRAIQLGIYLLMGWLCVFALDPIIKGLSEEVFNLLLYGGLFYTTGIVFYLFDSRVSWFHGMWHLFVLGGSMCHFTAVALLY